MNTGDHASGFDFRQATRWNQENAVTPLVCHLLTEFVHVSHAQSPSLSEFGQTSPGMLVSCHRERGGYNGLSGTAILGELVRQGGCPERRIPKHADGIGDRRADGPDDLSKII